MKTVRRPPYPKWNPGYFPCSSLTPLPLSSRRPSVSFGGFGFMEGFLRPGLDAGNWTDRNMYIGVGVVPTGPGEMSVYYAEHFKLPTVRIRRGTLRTDGFVSAAAGYSGGELVTRPLTFTGGEMLLNYSTSAVGSIRVELQGVDGRPLDGFRMSDSPELYGDEIERAFPWGNGANLASLAGRRVRLRLAMKDADLFFVAVHVGCSDRVLMSF